MREKRDRIIDGLGEAAHWIEEVAGQHDDVEASHIQAMLKAIEEAISEL